MKRKTDHLLTRRLATGSLSSLLAAAGLLAIAACGSAPDEPEGGGTVHQPLDQNATPQSCAAACDQLDGCGLLVQYGVDHGSCVNICTSGYTEQEATWAMGATCQELEQVISGGSVPSQCAQACDQVEACGLLAQYGIDPNECEGICEADFSEAQVSWALSATCDDIDAALAAVLGQSPPPTPCEQACDKVEACGLLTQYNVDAGECELICEHAYGDQYASLALQLSCAEIDTVLAANPPPSACDLGCAKVDTCGILAQLGVDLPECMAICASTYSAAQVSWALAASCSELEQVL